MPRFNRLFWKVFFSLWLSSFAVMMVTALVISELAERESFRSKVDFRMRLEAERFIERYEENPTYRRKVDKRQQRHGDRARPQNFWNSMHNGIPLFSIEDTQGKLIIGSHKPKPGKRHEIEITSEQGQEYSVTYYQRPPPDSLSRWQGFIFSIQALLILLSSTIASFIVSAIVVRPINQLRQYVKRLQEGEFSVRTENKLQLRGDEIGDFARDFNQMAEYVENTLKGQQQLFQNVSHELRAPLARLLAASGIIEQQIGHNHPAVNRIQLECERLSKLIDELLSLAKLQQQTQTAANVDVAPLLSKLVADSRFSQPLRQIELSTDSSIKTVTKGSSALLERTIGNVLGNSLKHTPSDSKIDIHLLNIDKKLHIIIEDNGPGVPDQLIGRLCEPFFRLDTNVDGHGLGLGIARQAMQAQHGELILENIKPHGLRVTLILQLI